MLHHGVSLRWEGKWNSDAELADPRRIQRTLALMGFDEPLREAQGIARSRMEAQVALQRWRAAAPHGLEAFREVLENEQIIWLDALVTAHPTLAQAEHRLRETSLDQDHAIRALLRWYGSGTGTWGCFPAYEDSARAMLWRFSSEDIVRAIESSTLTDEELGGAARYFGEWHFQRLRAADATLVPAEMRGQLLAHVAASQIDDNLARLQAAFGPSVRDS